MLHKSFKPAKCKTSLKLAVARIKLLRNKRQEGVRGLKRELAQLLENGQHQTARIRVEHLIREEKTMSAYDLIELYCELIVARLSIIESQKSCPIDLKEAISSVIFASPRCADLPELMDIRKHFTAKYGKDFINSALEVRPDCGVSHLVVEKLSARAPDTNTKIKSLAEVAKGHNIEWDPKAFEDQHQKPHEDLLNGPNTFASASMTPIESSMNSSVAPIRTNESNTRAHQNETASKPTSSSVSSQTNARPAADSRVPFTSLSESRPSENGSGGAEVNNSYLRDQNTPNQPTRRMEFRDATSAAKAAAESAEMASIAARAAADLASSEHILRQNLNESNESVAPSRRYEKPERLRGLLGEDINDKLVTKPYDEKSEVRTLHIDERMQGISEGEATMQSNKSPFHYTQAYTDDNISNVNLHKDDVTSYGHSRSISSESENVDEAEFSNNVNTFDNDFQNSNNNEYDGDETIRVDDGESLSRSNRKLSTSDYSAIVFDDYGSDIEDSSSMFGRNGENLLDSQQEDKPSSFRANIGLFSGDKYRSEPVSENSNAHLFTEQLHLFTESNIDELSEAKATFPSPSYDSVPATFDDSESEEEVASSAHKEAMKLSLPDESVHEPNDTYREEREIRETNRSSGGSSSHLKSQPSLVNQKAPIISNNLVKESDYSSTDEEEPEPLRLTITESLSKNEGKEKSGTSSANLDADDLEISNDLSYESRPGINFGRLKGGFKHTGFPRPPYVRSSGEDDSGLSKKISGDASITEKVTEDATMVEEKFMKEVVIPQEPLYQSRKKVDKEVSSISPSTYYDPDSSEQSYSVGRSAYKDNVSARSNQSAYVSPVSDTSTPSYPNWTVASSRMKAQRESSSRMDDAGLDGSEANLGSKYTAASRVNADVKLSRRTRDIPRDMPLEAKSSSSKISGVSKPSSEQPSESPKQTRSTLNESLKPSQLSSTEYTVPENKSGTETSGSSEVSASRDSLKKAPHTHPKQPDYDSLASHFHALRSNRQ